MGISSDLYSADYMISNALLVLDEIYESYQENDDLEVDDETEEKLETLEDLLHHVQALIVKARDQADEDEDEDDHEKASPDLIGKRVRIQEGVADYAPYNAKGDIMNFSGLTGMITEAVGEIYTVEFDAGTEFPQGYIDFAESRGEIWDSYYFYRENFDIID